MRSTVLVLAALSMATMASAQPRGGLAGPFTGYEAEALSQLWPEIRRADEFSDINWRAYGLSRPPGDAEAQRVLALNWDELRRETRFENIDWEDYDAGTGFDRRRGDRFGQRSSVFDDDLSADETGPFTYEEAATLSRIWPEIREAARFDDVDWRGYGLRRAPGGPEAQRILARNWDELRQASRFEDIEWDRYDAGTGFDRRGERFGRTQRDSVFDEGGNSPFTYEEAATLGRVWPEVRQAAEFDDVDWRSVGLSGPPGDREARRILARHWGELRMAENFGDIDWEATTGYRSR